jgi:hypothetical protein
MIEIELVAAADMRGGSLMQSGFQENRAKSSRPSRSDGRTSAD